MKLVVLATLAICAGVSAAEEYKLVCYYTNWAQYRKASGMNFEPEDIDPGLCTHVIFSFAYVENGVLVKREWNDEDTEWSKGMYTRFNDMKKKNPSLKTMLAVGGWTHPWDQFSKAVYDKDTRKKLNKSIIKFLRRWNFDGFDLDWEYPANRGSPASDKQKYTAWCAELREAFEEEAKTSGKDRLLLSAAVAAGKSNIDSAYEIGKIAKSLDFINLMAYDLHGSWENFAMHHSPLKAGKNERPPQSYLTVEWATRYWKKQIVDGGSPSTKLILGLPTYGRSFTLANSNNHDIRAPASGGGAAGPGTGEKGILAYYEVCDMLKQGGQRVWNDEQKFTYLYKGDQWVGYDDQQSMAVKIDFIKKEGLGGGMFWTLDLDDFNGKKCGQGKYPLISFVAKGLKGKTPKPIIPKVVKPKPTTEPKKCSLNRELVNGRCLRKCRNGKVRKNGQCVKPGKETTTKPGATDAPTTETGEPKEFRCQSDGVFADPNSCLHFMHCSNSIAYRKLCPANLHFSETIGACTWPNMSECQ